MSDHAEMVNRLGGAGEEAGPPPRADQPLIPALRASRRRGGCLGLLVVAEHLGLGLVFVGRKWSLLLCSGGSGADRCPRVMMVVVRPGAGLWWWSALALIAGCLVAAARGRTRRRWPFWLSAILLPIVWFVFANAVYIRPLL